MNYKGLVGYVGLYSAWNGAYQEYAEKTSAKASVGRMPVSIVLRGNVPSMAQ